MRIIIFGTGEFYKERRSVIPSDIEITAFLDNNCKLQGGTIETAPIVSPDVIQKLIYDKIILMSTSEEAMKDQLLELGVNRKDIWYWERLVSEINRGVFKLYCGNKNPGKKFIRKILLITTNLNYNGGTIAALYAAKALQERGNFVILAAPGGNETFIKEAQDDGTDIVLCPSLPYLHKEEFFWINQFDAVLVNVFQMISCACEISKMKPVLWWIHEPGNVYGKIVRRFPEYMDSEQLKAVDIYAVSDIAQNNFNFYFSGRIKKTLPFGIPDQRKENAAGEKKNCFIFALIGGAAAEKGQDIFIEAVKLLNDEEKENVRFWLIGFIGTDEYGSKIRELASKELSVEIKGQLTRDGIDKAYEEIDVVVCPSREETLSIAAVESMMYGKACIVSDKTGIAQYIKDGENGFICRTGDPVDLCGKLKWMLHNQKVLKTIGKRARAVYDEFFTLEKFGNRLETALQHTADYWCNNS